MLDAMLFLLIAVVVAVGFVVLLARRRPDHFHAARTLPIAASPERLHGLIDNLRAMNTWNPYALRDTSGTSRYSGPDSGPGATFEFDGPKSGSGSVSVIDSNPTSIVMRLQMRKPMACDNRVEFKLEPQGATTFVTWAMSGRASLPARIFALFVDCDRMLARDFDEGLTNLRAIAEKP